jgi:O-antigen ligase
VAAVVLALCLGVSIATENYALLVFAGTLVVVATLVFMPGYIPLFVFGLLMPFSLPVPFVWNFPFLMLALGICGVKYWLQRGLESRQNLQRSIRLKAVSITVALFFTWVFLRYCMKPAFPNLMGWGANVTGFRAWLNYALSFGVLFALGRVIANRADIVRLVHWLAYVSIFFILIFVPVSLSKSMALAGVFVQLGMSAGALDNGMVRFVALPEFGLILLSLLLLPNLLKLSRAGWWFVFALAAMAIVLGANRGSLGMAFVIVMVIPVLRRKLLQTVIVTGSVLLLSAVAYFAGPTLSQLPHTGVLRVFGLMSPALAESTGGNADLEWREVRWQRGLEEIRKHPVIGVGYGGLENALGSDIITEEDSKDVSVATGTVHNGYIASAVALGVPAALLFLFVFLTQIFGNARRGWALQRADPVAADLHCLVCANLLAYAASIFIGTDTNDPFFWFLIGLGLIARQVKRQERRKTVAPATFVQPALAAQPA